MKRSELKELIREVLSEKVEDRISSIVGKTIKSVDYDDENTGNSKSVRIDFTDGKAIAIFTPDHAAGIDYTIHP